MPVIFTTCYLYSMFYCMNKFYQSVKSMEAPKVEDDKWAKAEILLKEKIRIQFLKQDKWRDI